MNKFKTETKETEFFLSILINTKRNSRYDFSVQNKVTKTCSLIKFIYTEKAIKFCEIFKLLLTVVKSKVKISQNFVAFSEYMNFKNKPRLNIKDCNVILNGLKHGFGIPKSVYNS